MSNSQSHDDCQNAATSNPRFYFAYGSNLSLAQMSARCPDSKLHSPCLALLRGYTWVISPRGYANVIPTTPSETTIKSPIFTASQYMPEHINEVVFGLLYEITSADEELLDGFEGVPSGYGKVEMEVELIGMPHEEKEIRWVDALVYVDSREGTGKCQDEYVERMSKGVADALKNGMPRTWAKEIIGKWVPLVKENLSLRTAVQISQISKRFSQISKRFS